MNLRFSPIFLVFFGALGSCAPRASSPIPEASARSVLLPSGLATLAQGSDYEGTPGAITFGAASGRSALYLRFSSEWRSHGAPVRAFVALEPREGALIDGEPVRVQAWRVQNEWRPEALHTWSDKPELAPPFSETTVSSSPSNTLRIEVTELLRFASNNPELDHGIALIATGGNGHGATFTTGVNGGNAPRLEIYSR